MKKTDLDKLREAAFSLYTLSTAQTIDSDDLEYMSSDLETIREALDRMLDHINGGSRQCVS